MAIIDLQQYLVRTFTEFLVAVRDDGNMTVINDVFATMPEEDRMAISEYLMTTNITSDLDDRNENGRNLYIIPSYPIVGVPFPQIGIYLPGEEMQDMPLGQHSGADSVPVIVDGVTVAWDIEYCAIANISYRADIFCNTPEESVWLSRLLQRCLYAKVLELDAMGVKEPRFSMADLRLEQEQFPSQVFARGINLTAKAFHTWTQQIPAVNYRIGNNLFMGVGKNTALTGG